MADISDALADVYLIFTILGLVGGFLAVFFMFMLGNQLLMIAAVVIGVILLCLIRGLFRASRDDQGLW